MIALIEPSNGRGAPSDGNRKGRSDMRAVQNEKHVDEETALLACIEENSLLPPAEQRRYEQLRRKCERQTLSERELAEYQALLQQLEARNVKRLEALIALAWQRGTPLQLVLDEIDAGRTRQDGRKQR